MLLQEGVDLIPQLVAVQGHLQIAGHGLAERQGDGLGATGPIQAQHRRALWPRCLRGGWRQLLEFQPQPLFGGVGQPEQALLQGWRWRLLWPAAPIRPVPLAAGPGIR